MALNTNHPTARRLLRGFASGSCIFAIVALGPLVQAAEHESMKTLYDFTSDTPDTKWRSNNDGVMGGISQGGADVLEDGMLFKGDLSLENNGGFSSIYARTDLDLSEFEGIRLKVLGDGRNYQLRLESDAVFSQRGPVSFSSGFKATKGEWIEVFLPFSELNQTWRGRQLSGHVFNAKDIRRIGIMLADGMPGAFHLKIASIRAE